MRSFTLSSTFRLVTVLTIALLVSTGSLAQTGYIYIHQKNINEESSTDFAFTLKNSSGTIVNTWNFNDQASSNNVAFSGINSYIFDIGVGHGAGGDGELWAIGDSTNAPNGSWNNWGGIYHRAPGDNKWTMTMSDTFKARAIDGAYAGQFVVAKQAPAVYGTSVYFYYNGVYTALPGLPNTSTTDVTCNNGRIAIVNNATVYVYSESYTPASAPATNGTWTKIVPQDGSSVTRIDMNPAGNLIAYGQGGTAEVKTVDFSGNMASLGFGGDSAAKSYEDVTYDDNNNLYVTCYEKSTSAVGAVPIIAKYNGSSWSKEKQGLFFRRITAGVASSAWGVTNYSSSIYSQGIYTRATDNAGNVYWIDDDRLKTTETAGGNGVMVPLSPGTYTVEETLPNTTWELGRYNLYDPANASSFNIPAKTATITVTDNKLVFVEFVNYKVNDKPVALNCTQQTLESFNADDYGSAPYFSTPYGATPAKGSAYHFTSVPALPLGYYIMAPITSVVLPVSSFPTMADHTGNGGYFMLTYASYAQDELYWQRLSNLQVGVQYQMSFYAIDATPRNAIRPNLFFGAQDAAGNSLGTASTGVVPKDSTWHQYTVTFTAASGTATLYIRNQSAGGSGNVVALDDITLTALPTTLPANTGSAQMCAGTNYTFSNAISGGSWASADPSVASINTTSGLAQAVAAGTTNITYTYTNASGCASSQPSGLTVAPSPVATLAASKYSVCAIPAGSINLTGNLTTATTGPYTYAWAGSGVVNNTGNITTTAAPVATGNYTLQVTDAAGCTGTATTPYPVKIDEATPSIAFSCGTNGSGQVYGSLYEANGASWLWTTTSGGRFFTSAALSVNSDSTQSQLQAPYVATNGGYAVTITNAAGCKGSMVYTVSNTSCGMVLADDKVTLTAVKSGNTAVLGWAVPAGTLTASFLVERSADGRQWLEIATVNAGQAGSNQYSYVDAAPAKGVNYYRVIAVNNNGQATTSAIRQLTFGNTWAVKLYPNPATSFAVLDVDNDKEEKVQINVLTNQGSVTLSTAGILHKGANHIVINGVGRLAQGIYTVKLVTATQVYTAKLVKGE